MNIYFNQSENKAFHCWKSYYKNTLLCWGFFSGASFSKVPTGGGVLEKYQVPDNYCLNVHE